MKVTIIEAMAAAKHKMLKGGLSFLFAVALLACVSALPFAHGWPCEGPGGSGRMLARQASQRGEELRRQWNLVAAEASFREAALLEPASVESTLGLARIARTKLDYALAIRLLDQAARQEKGVEDVLDEYGLVYLAAEEPQRARQYFEREVEVSTSDTRALIGLASVQMLERDYDGARSTLRGCLAREPQSAGAHAMLARVLLENSQHSEAAAEATRAIELDAFNVEAMYVLAFAKSIERNASQARSLARRAVALDPFNAGARKLLSQYVDGQAGYAQKVPELARRHYERGCGLKQEGELHKARAELDAALAIEPRYYRALIALGDVWLRQGEYNQAIEAAKIAISVDPDGAVAHLELSSAYRGIHERGRAEIGAVDFAELFYKRPVPSAYAATREVFPGYGSLHKLQQAVIDAAVAPLASFLPRLARSRARHYLLAYDQRPSELRGFADVADVKTFDGRYYDSLRGVGGRTAVSGIEYLDQAARGGFNAIAHEFAHQVHIAAMAKSEVKSIHKLYERARREGRTLDYYAAANEYEYFAQGYEAFISERKRPSSGVTARHTCDELASADPDLYRFLLWLSGRARVGGEQRFERGRFYV